MQTLLGEMPMSKVKDGLIDKEESISSLITKHVNSMNEAWDKGFKSPVVNQPSHYNTGKYEVIDVIEDWKLDFSLGNAVKYIARAGKKDPAKEKEDLEKALYYVKRRIEKL